MLASFLGVLPILTPPLCALAFILCEAGFLIGLLIAPSPSIRGFWALIEGRGERLASTGLGIFPPLQVTGSPWLHL
jgi:hypothetical protein